MVQASGVVFLSDYQTWTAWSIWLCQSTAIAEETRGARRAVSWGYPASWQTNGAQRTWRWYRWALHTVETWTQQCDTVHRYNTESIWLFVHITIWMFYLYYPVGSFHMWTVWTKTEKCQRGRRWAWRYLQGTRGRAGIPNLWHSSRNFTVSPEQWKLESQQDCIKYDST